ncbi:hypothetical protein BZL29_8573 [Mycobacterium kansasii]|uniref:Uncharacterized protein n=1 Tax=Mycobacterium kansasii TaxID=1768 RepID=A0A1V3W8T9_MYCKA|nr:hypothetical protein BZL29_8573 [Mycobacterium kansasii]
MFDGRVSSHIRACLFGQFGRNPPVTRVVVVVFWRCPA